MSKRKEFFGYFLIFFSFMMIGLIGIPQIYSSNDSGRIDKDKIITLDFLQDEKSDILLLYFGYVGCDSICVPSLSELNEMYAKLDHTKIQIYFLNLLKVVDKELPILFAHSFNKDFKGIYLDNIRLKSATKQFNLIYTYSMTDKYELNHSGYLYVLVKEGSQYKLKYIYTTRPFNQKSIVKDLDLLIKQRGNNEKNISTLR